MNGKRALSAALALMLMLSLAAVFTITRDAQTPGPETPLSEQEPTPAPTPAPTPELTPEPTPERTYSGVWGEKFADKFTEGEIIEDEHSYRSENINVTLTKVEEDMLVYYVAEVYVSDLKYLRSGFANGAYKDSRHRGPQRRGISQHAL